MTDAAAELESINARLKKLADDENCSICKEDLELARRGVEASSIKLGRMNSLVKELESKDLMNVDEELKKRYVPKVEPVQIQKGKATNNDAGLGINDMLLDVADMLDDVKELNTLNDLLPGLPQLPGLGKAATTPGAGRQIMRRPPLPHELLLGLAKSE